MKDSPAIIWIVSIVCLTAIILCLIIVSGLPVDCRFDGGSVQLDIDMEQYPDETNFNHFKIGDIQMHGMRCNVPAWLVVR